VPRADLRDNPASPPTIPQTVYPPAHTCPLAARAYPPPAARACPPARVKRHGCPSHVALAAWERQPCTLVRCWRCRS